LLFFAAAVGSFEFTGWRLLEHSISPAARAVSSHSGITHNLSAPGVPLKLVNQDLKIKDNLKKSK
jgi:hypothetical protein